MKIKDLEIDEFRELIRETVEETLNQFSVDPDEGKEVRDEVKKQLVDSLERNRKENPALTEEEVAERLGLSD